MIFPLFVTLDRLDPAMREASKDLGASRWKTFRQVTLPLAAPGIVAGLLLVFIPLSGDYITALVLGGAKGNMAGAMVATEFNTGLNWALGSAQAVILIIDDLGHGGRVRHARSRDADHRPRTPEDHPPLGRGVRCMSAAEVVPVEHQRDRGSVALRIWGVVVYVFLFLPILVIVIYSFNNGRSILTLDGVGTGGVSNRDH